MEDSSGAEKSQRKQCSEVAMREWFISTSPGEGTSGESVRASPLSTTSPFPFAPPPCG